MAKLEPTRWIEGDPSSPLARAVAGARADVGTAADLARVRAALGPLKAAGMPPAAGGAATASALAGKGALIVVGAALLGSGLWLAGQTRERGRSPVPRARGVVQAAAPAPLPAQAPVATARAQPPIAEPAVRAGAPAPEAAAVAAHAPRARGRRAKPAQPSAVPEQVTTPGRGPSVADELALLQRAQALIDTRPAEALGLLDTHAHEHPAGVFAQERESLAIDALRKLGRRDAAHARARAFVQRYPGSPHTRRITTWLEPNPGGHKPEAEFLPTR